MKKNKYRLVTETYFHVRYQFQTDWWVQPNNFLCSSSGLTLLYIW